MYEMSYDEMSECMKFPMMKCLSMKCPMMKCLMLNCPCDEMSYDELSV